MGWHSKSDYQIIASSISSPWEGRSWCGSYRNWLAINSFKTSNSARVREALWPLLVGSKLPCRANHSSQKHYYTNCLSLWKINAKLLCSWATLAEGLLLYVDGEPFSVNWLIKRSNFCWVKAEIRWFELWCERGRELSVLGGSKTHSRPIPKHSFRRCEGNILVFLCESPTTDPYCETTLFLPRRHEISC